MKIKLIQDEKMLDKFLEWLPKNKDGQKYYLSLFARKKYCESISSDKFFLKRFVSNHGDIKRKIKQLEVDSSLYTLSGKPIPQEALAVYITVNPRDLLRASFKTVKILLDKIQQGKHCNPASESLNALQVSGVKDFIIFDLDSKPMKCIDFLPTSCYNVIETRGGYHLIVQPNQQFPSNWHQKVMKLGVDQKGDLLSPLPGTSQGGFIPKFKENQ